MTASTPTPRHPALKARQRELRHTFPESLGLRVHRALSWLNRAEQEPDDHDACFILLWIAFNAAYAQEFLQRRDLSETRLRLKFLNRLIDSRTPGQPRLPRLETPC